MGRQQQEVVGVGWVMGCGGEGDDNNGWEK